MTTLKSFAILAATFTLTCIICAMLIRPAHSAALLGTLVSSESIMTMTGQPAMRCTYDVGGQHVPVIVPGMGMCPISMYFN